MNKMKQTIKYKYILVFAIVKIHLLEKRIQHLVSEDAYGSQDTML